MWFNILMSDNFFINILIAEDNDVSRDMMAGVLRTQGFRVIGAIDGESAIKVVEERPVDLALVDINMSPTGGFEFVKHLVAKGLKIPLSSSQVMIPLTYSQKPRLSVLPKSFKNP